jgi:hypothetical protein
MKLSRMLLPAMAIAVVLAAALVEPALAASSAKDVGKNLGDLLKTWATSIFGGICAIMACVYVGQRQVGPAMVFAGLALVLGMFVFASSGIGHLVQALAKEVLP